MPCARSLDPFPHPSIPPQCKATDWAVVLRGNGHTHRERDRRGCGLNLAAWIYRDSPSGFLFVSGTAPWSHSTESGCYYEAGGLREAGFWTDPSPSPRATEPTHTRPRPACNLLACGWGPRRGQDNGVVGRHEPTCLKPEFQKCPQNCSPNRLWCRFVGLLPVSTPSRSTVACTVCISSIHRLQSRLVAAAAPAAPLLCVRP